MISIHMFKGIFKESSITLKFGIPRNSLRILKYFQKIILNNSKKIFSSQKEFLTTTNEYGTQEQ